MPAITFADVVHDSLTFSTEIPSQRLLLQLIDNPWLQRLRDISQTANTRLVYMFSEHSRFGHSLGVAYLAEVVMEALQREYSEEVKKYRSAVACAALLHDVAHIAPGSHTAWKTWFPEHQDQHEELAKRVIEQDPSLSSILGDELIKQVTEILGESENVPKWTWQIISGGGWNVDRGNWCIADSILAGVSYGQYNIPALTESLVLSKDGELALRENRLDAMMHFAVSRHAMYRQIYQHRVILAADILNHSIVLRARELGDELDFADQYMREVLTCKEPLTLPLETIFNMRECWWRYHILQWRNSKDRVLADLAARILNRSLLKTIRINDSSNLDSSLVKLCSISDEMGYSSKYYCGVVSTEDVQAGDLAQSMPVLLESGRIRPLSDSDPLCNALLRESKSAKKFWLAAPKEVKERFLSLS